MAESAPKGGKTMSDNKIWPLIARHLIPGAVVGIILAASFPPSRAIVLFVGVVVAGAIILVLANLLLGIKAPKQAFLRDAPLSLLGMLAGIGDVALYQYIFK
jgi:hypothetical protein